MVLKNVLLLFIDMYFKWLLIFTDLLMKKGSCGKDNKKPDNSIGQK